MDLPQKEKYGIEDLVTIVKILREPGGCPWDREQTHKSIRQNLLEETYEVADAIDLNDPELLCEELGDVLLQILLHARMEEEKGSFTFSDVCDGISKKLIYRHPHVFASQEDLTSGQVSQNWEELKNIEKSRETIQDRLDSVPRSLPALMRCKKVQKRADSFGFGYPSPQQALDDLDAEIKELKAAICQQEGLEHELGDVLFSAVNVGRHIGVDAEEALTASTDRFTGRATAACALCDEQGSVFNKMDNAQQDAVWKKAKALQET